MSNPDALAQQINALSPVAKLRLAADLIEQSKGGAAILKTARATASLAVSDIDLLLLIAERQVSK